MTRSCSWAFSYRRSKSPFSTRDLYGASWTTPGARAPHGTSDRGVEDCARQSDWYQAERTGGSDPEPVDAHLAEEWRPVATVETRSPHDIEHSGEAWSAIRAIVREQIEEKRMSPKDDLLSAIANGQIDGQLIDVDSAINLASTVFVGGLDTLPSNIGWSCRYLANHPEARQRIIGQPSVVPRVVEEFLRLWTVTAEDGRILSRDVEFKGAHMRAGDRVVICIGLANHDSAEFEDPLTADFDRKVNRHIAFAAGPHRCLGSHLARHELEVALEKCHAHIPDYRIVPDTKLVYDGGGVFAIDILPLEWET